MPETDIGQVTTTDMKNIVTDYSVTAETTDGPTGQKEIEYNNAGWSQQLGYYKSIPELQAAIDAKARWTVGKGFNADETTKFIIGKIRGFGKESFNTILENMIRAYHVGGEDRKSTPLNSNH